MPNSTVVQITGLHAKPLTHNDMQTCPECDGPLAHTSGCVICLQCGWGRCG